MPVKGCRRHTAARQWECTRRQRQAEKNKEKKKKNQSITGEHTLSCKNRPRRNPGPREAGRCPGTHNPAERDQHTACPFQDRL